MTMVEKDNIIKLKNVDAYLNDKLVLENINFAVSRGSFTAIIGPNGAGKTTLFKVILGLLPHSSGEVIIFDKSPLHLGKDRKRIAYVPQIRSVDMKFPASVRDTVIMGRYARLGLFHKPKLSDYEIADEAMEKTDVLSIANKPVSKLSGGQLQRVFIARALAGEPEIIFLDEPTSGVDQLHTSDFYALLKSLRTQSMTILMVSHDVGVVAGYVDSIACLNRKMIVHGLPQEVLTGNALKEMYGCEAMFFHHGSVPHMVVCEEECR